MEDVTCLTRSCPRCGKPLKDDAPEGLCGACLLLAGTESLTRSTIDDAVTVASGPGVSTMLVDAPRLETGQAWGPYRIGRLLGRGGMGEVHEAEHTDSGRRIALKVLRSRLQDADDRARFLREGQLAASISHPHTVYIFGSEEIAGVPVISMELLPGGTLKDRVVARGPLPVAEAVSAVLDIIGGLDAAQAAGILHRDIKPSNCFVDSDGAVKVGDFGLSISTLARDVRQQLATGFEGTPQFAAPEQLRGEPLDVRADIYAVGATLYYLLTGQPPFEARDLRELVDRVNNEPPRSPRHLRREIPQGLASVVLRCLSKTAAQRPASYMELAEALRPFAVLEERPAALGLRLLAGIVDMAILGAPMSIWRAMQGEVVVNGQRLPASMDSVAMWAWLFYLLYFFVLERIWGASLGKRLFRLHVAAPAGGNRTARIAYRTAVFHLPWILMALLLLAAGPIGPAEDRQLAPNVRLNAREARGGIESLITLTLIASLFVTARRRNGWAGLHEYVSGTRVVSRSGARLRESTRSSAPLAAAVAPSSAIRYGPFNAVAEVWQAGGDRLVVGFDSILRRHVWIHVVPPGTPAISTSRRDVSRTGRLHWLTGRRSPTENWDAFEAPDGQPLLKMEKRAIGWSLLKSWLLDAANELVAAARDGSTPVLRLDRIWIRGDGRLVLLDFPSPELGVQSRPGATADLDPVALLSAVATETSSSPQSGLAMNMPLSAGRMLTAWSSASPPSLNIAHTELVRVSAAPDRVSRVRRALPIVAAAIPITFMLAFTLFVMLPVMDRFFGPATTEMLSLLEMLYQPRPAPDSRLADPEVRDAIETYLVGQHGRQLTDEGFWSSPVIQQGIGNRLGPTARAVAARHQPGSVTPDELAYASTVIAPELQRQRQRNRSIWAVSGVILMALGVITLLPVLLLSVVSSLIVPGGIVTRMLGHAVVTRGNVEIGRPRSLARVLVAWAPLIAWLVYLGFSPRVQGFVPNPPRPLLGLVIVAGAMAIGGILTIVRPGRGPHDRLMGTWVVSR